MTLVDRVATRFGPDRAAAAGLLRHLLEEKGYDPARAAELTALARSANASWELRCLAVLLVEHQLLRARAAGVALAEALAAAEVVLPAADATASAVSPASPPRPGARLERRLERGLHLHARIRGAATRLEDLEAFVNRSAEECRLALGRYLLPPTEVVARIETLLRTSRAGAPARRPESDATHEAGDGDEPPALASMPVYEAEICRRLLASGLTYWVGERTPSRPFALVEYPASTVVCVVKPPGSDLEIEIKRTGLSGRHPLTVVWARDGKAVAPSHRLQGGSSADALTCEAENAERLARRFELIHGREAPVSRVLAVRRIETLPTASGAVPLEDYLAEKTHYGDGWERMQHEMDLAIQAFRRERQTAPSYAPTPRHRGGEFLRLARPAQALLTGTSSLRLDLLAARLGDDAAACLDPAGEPVHAAAARRALDGLLEEILDRYEPPRRRHPVDGHVAAALAANRSRADACFLALTRQIGELWGTLAALRGGSRAESFVARNVGLRRVWRDGEDRVEIRFMDHDNLELPNRELDQIHPHKTLRRMAIDAMFICGDDDEITELGHLARIYRVDGPTRAAGARRLETAAQAAYRRSIEALLGHPELRRMHHPGFLETLLDLDLAVAIYREAGAGGHAPWRDAVRARLVDRGRPLRIVDDYLHGLEESHRFLDRHGDLFLGRAEIAAAPATAAGSGSGL